ncbi:hypothetical protein ACIQVR_06885 [Streptomyces xanthochromogenes]|uniref:hypothetical protein n=1 Tax=Streptomyces xanthochromogenes TaxID=67384 RepID=UPI003803FC06
MATPTKVSTTYWSLLDNGPRVTRIIGGMASAAGMVMLFEHEEGDHIVHYHCEKTDGRQHLKYFEEIPSGFEFVGTTPVSGYEYVPRNGGNRFADIYRHIQAA